MPRASPAGRGSSVCCRTTEFRSKANRQASAARSTNIGPGCPTDRESAPPNAGSVPGQVSGRRHDRIRTRSVPHDLLASMARRSHPMLGASVASPPKPGAAAGEGAASCRAASPGRAGQPGLADVCGQPRWPAAADAGARSRGLGSPVRGCARPPATPGGPDAARSPRARGPARQERGPARLHRSAGSIAPVGRPGTRQPTQRMTPYEQSRRTPALRHRCAAGGIGHGGLQQTCADNCLRFEPTADCASTHRRRASARIRSAGACGMGSQVHVGRGLSAAPVLRSAAHRHDRPR